MSQIHQSTYHEIDKFHRIHGERPQQWLEPRRLFWGEKEHNDTTIVHTVYMMHNMEDVYFDIKSKPKKEQKKEKKQKGQWFFKSSYLQIMI